MKDFYIKTWILFNLIYWGIKNGILEWNSEIKGHNLDALYCCDGKECGCRAITKKDVYYNFAKEPLE